MTKLRMSMAMTKLKMRVKMTELGSGSDNTADDSAKK